MIRSMSPDAGQRADAQANRTAVIDAAIELLTDNPDASMQEIADHSGLGRTTVYRHFPSREKLYEALIEMVLERSTAEVQEITESGMDPAATMRVVGRKNVELGLRYRFLYPHQELTRPVIRARTREGDRALSLYLENAQAQGDVGTGLSVVWLTAATLTLTMAMVVEVLGGRLEREDAGEILGETLVATIGAA